MANPFFANATSIACDPTEKWDTYDFCCKEVGILPGPPALMIGIGFSGKTFFVQDFALSVTTGRKFLGAYPVKKGKVLHLDYENSTVQTKTRYRRLMHGGFLRPGAIQDGHLLVTQPTLKLDDEGCQAALEDALNGYTLCIVDSFRAAIKGDENASEVRQSLDVLGRASEKANCSVIVILHSGKGAQSDNRFAARGSSALFDAAGTALTLSVKENIYTLRQIKSRTGKLADIRYAMRDSGDFVNEINATEGLSLVRL